MNLPTRLLAIAILSLCVASPVLSANHALQFDGQNDFVDAGQCADIRRAQPHITIECWFKTEVGAGDRERVLITNRQADDGADFPSVTVLRGHALFVVDEQGLRAQAESQTSVNDNQWHHFAGVVDDRTWTLYVDGEQEAQIQDNIGLEGSNYNLHFGHHGAWGVFYPGAIDEVRIWLTSRTADEIRNNMHTMLSGNEEGLYGYWNFDEGEGQTVHDLTRFGNDGVLGSDDQQANDDPSWIESEAPVYGGELSLSRNTLHFIPTPIGRTPQATISLSNTSPEGDDRLIVEYAFSFPGGAVPRWLGVENAAGRVAPAQQTDVVFTIFTDSAGVGDFATTAHIESNAVNLRNADVPVSIRITEAEGRLWGVVTDAANDTPLEGITVQLAGNYDLYDTTDAEGRYEFPGIGSTNYSVRVVAADYLPSVEEVELDAGQDREYNIALLHSAFSPSANVIDASVPVEDSFDYPLAIHNTGNGLLSWSVERVFPEGHVVDPWTRRAAFDAGTDLNDDRIEGVAFDGTNFYLAGAAGADSSKIYVLDHDFEQVRSFDQLTHTRYGMKDLEWDGELLWGSGEQRVYGFNNEGDSIISFAGPFNPTNCIAYDTDDGILWLSGTTTNIVAYDREGNAIGRSLNRKNLRIYGLAYWPEDPDGYNLYIFDTPGAGFQLVHKMNTANGDTMLACSIPVENGESPTGSYICNDYDPYAWVMISMQNLAPANGGDRLAIWQLGSRTDWVQVSPLQDVVAAGESKDVTVSFNSAGMPEDLRMEATLRFTHDGVGSVTEIPVAMNVTGEGGLTQRLLRLSRGWNLVSVNIDVAGAENFDSLLTPLVDGGLLVLAKDQGGNFYWPARGYNGIEVWDGLQSYWLKQVGNAELRLSGTSLAYDHEVPLRAGWNCVSYLPRQPVEASVALSGLGENLVIARDGAGRFYLPAYGFSDIGQMREGSGYQLHVREDATLIYRLANRGASMPERYSLAEVSWMEGVSRTTRQHNLLVKSDLEAGTRLEAMTPSGLVAGRGVVGLDGMAGLTLWGDDPETPVVEGFTEGEAVAVSGAPLNSQLSTLNFTDGGWGVINLTTSSVPVSFGLSETYPNPFNGELRVVFGLTSSGEGRLAAYDLSGREVGLLWEGKASAGEHRIVWNASGLPSGVYLLRLESAGLTSTVKVVMVR